MSHTNPLYELFQQIKEYCDTIEEMNIEIDKLFSPTTQEAIDAWEIQNGAKLPEGYKNWLLLSNGFDMNQSVVLHGIEEITKLEIPGYEGFYSIGSYIGDGSMLLTDTEGNFYLDDEAFGKEESTFEGFLEKWVIRHLVDEIRDNS